MPRRRAFLILALTLFTACNVSGNTDDEGACDETTKAAQDFNQFLANRTTNPTAATQALDQMINHLKNAPNANRDLNGAIKAAQQAAEDLKAAYQQNHSASAQPLANAMADVGSECSEVQSSLIVDPD